MVEQLAQGVAPEAAIHAVRVGRLTALLKPDGGVRGIVVGDVVRRLIARTISQQMSDAVKVATSPYQYALSTRAGCECISHVLQGLTELDTTPQSFSIDFIVAFDLISRGVMLQAVRDVSPSALSDNSVATVPVTYGKMMKVLSMRLTRAKAVSSGTVEKRKNPGARWQDTGVEKVWSEATWVRHD